MSTTQAISAAAAGAFTIGGDLTVNRLGYGAMRITGKGIWGPPADKAAALATLRRAVELGVNLIDTADSYGPYVVEELIAEALHPYPAGLVIATKGGWERPGPGQWTHNASPEHLTKAIEGSLKRLRLERIDVYQLHIPDPAVSFDASMETLARPASRARSATSRCPTSPANTSSARARSCPSSRCRTATASPIANGISSWIIATRTTSASCPGRPWRNSASRTRLSRRGREAIERHVRCRLRWRGC